MTDHRPEKSGLANTSVEVKWMPALHENRCSIEPASSSVEHAHRTRVVLVHGGARDAYQVALALQNSGVLETFVTDLYWNGQSLLSSMLPSGLTRLCQQRSAKGLDSRLVLTCGISGLLATLSERISVLPMTWRRVARRFSDAQLGRKAGRRALASQAGLFSYSYFGAQAFAAFGRPAMLFQVHPHPETVRQLLQEELRLNPQCSTSLNQEWELALPEKDFRRLVDEASHATHYVVASSFTRASLVEHGVPATDIAVVPYGVDLQRFRPPATERTPSATLQLLFVGRINQRKGVSYLLEAMRLLADVDVHLTICGRVVDDLSIFREFSQRVTIRPSVSAQDLVTAYQQADLFVFPSIAEGFGQVLLEALASGLPILSTTHTAAPDLIEEGVQGFIVEPRRADQLATTITWASAHRDQLKAMGLRARERAEYFTWERFRTGINAAVAKYLQDESEERAR